MTPSSWRQREWSKVPGRAEAGLSGSLPLELELELELSEELVSGQVFWGRAKVPGARAERLEVVVVLGSM